MATTITKPVKEIPADEKRTLEGMLGTALEGDQQVLILAYIPGVVPSEEEGADARRGIEQILAANQAFAKENGVTTTQSDDAIAEAMRHARRRV